MAPPCPICQTRSAKRGCPGLGSSRWAGGAGKICAHCCGVEREAGIDCPLDCRYLRAARRYDAERQPPPAEMPFPRVELDARFLDEQQRFIAGLAFLITKFAQDNPALRDPEALAALDALAETYQTLSSGLYYEKEPAAPLAARLFAAAKHYIAGYQEQQPRRTGALVESGAAAGAGAAEALRAAVFLRRLGATHTNGRPLSRAFLEYLRAQLPAGAEPAPAAERLIIPGA